MIDNLFPGLTVTGRILLIVGLIVVVAALGRVLRVAARWLLSPHGEGPQVLLRRRPKYASLMTLALSGLTFLIYFAGFGLILETMRIPLTAYLASASVVGLAIGFGSQGLVQDVVIGLTLIFSDALNIGDIAEIGGHTGRVDVIGLRFTTLVTMLEQRVQVPNRNIAQIVRYRNGEVRVVADVQIPAESDDAAVRRVIEPITRGMFAQYRGIVLVAPQLLASPAADPVSWRYLRVEFRLWPGQLALIETVFKPRALAALRTLDQAYADWMVTVTYRVA